MKWPVVFGGTARRVLPVLGGFGALGLASVAGAQTASFSMPTSLAPATLVTSLLTANQDYILVGAGAVVGLGLLAAVVHGLSRRASRAMR